MSGIYSSVIPMRTSLHAKITIAHVVNPSDSFTFVDDHSQNSLKKFVFFSKHAT